MQARFKANGKIYEIPEDKYIQDIRLWEPVNQTQTSQVQIQQSQIPQMGIQSGVALTLTGHTLQEHQQALDAAQTAGDKTAITRIKADYDREYQYQKDTGELGKESASVVSDKVQKQRVATAAKNYLDTYKELASKGDLTSEDAQRKLAYVAGKYNSEAGFGEGGKVLSAAELGILAPTLIKTERQRSQNIFEKWTGNMPEMTLGRLQESPEKAAKKMLLALENTAPEEVSKYTDIQNQLPNVSQGEGGWGANAKEIINSILGLPSQVINAPQNAVALQNQYGSMGQSVLSGQGPGRQLLGATTGMLPEYNQALGEPLQGGDVISRIVQRAQEKPLTTTLDVASVLPFLRLARGSQVTEGVNLPQNLIRQATDVVSGGGSKEYIARAATSEKAIPQNQVLLEEGILSKPTATGKITATAKAMENYGSQIADIYKNAKEVITGSELGRAIDTELKTSGYDAKTIRFIKQYINDRGNFDMSSGEVEIPQEKAWKVARDLEKNPPKMMKNPESLAAYKQLAQDAAKIIRNKLAELNPQVKPINARYSALADYMYNVLTNPMGIAGGGGMFNILGKAAKVTGDTLLNLLYKGASLGK
jgi:hypothetical protein